MEITISGFLVLIMILGLILLCFDKITLKFAAISVFFLAMMNLILMYLSEGL